MPYKPLRHVTEKHGSQRPTSVKRGYGRRWQKFRKWFLARHPMCADCDSVANEVHHVRKLKDEPALQYCEDNCVALCKSCHSARTVSGQ